MMSRTVATLAVEPIIEEQEIAAWAPDAKFSYGPLAGSSVVTAMVIPSMMPFTIYVW